MTRMYRLDLLLLILAAAAPFVACGGGSSASRTPLASTSAHADATPTAGGQPTALALNVQPARTPGAATTPATTTPGADASAVPGGSPPLPPFPNITVLADGTAVNADGTPVALPSAIPALTVIAAATPARIASGATISIATPPDAAGDFDVDVRIDGVTTPYLAFNVYVTFDPALLTAIVATPGTALSASPEGMFCVRAPATAGAAGIGCTVIQGPSAATNGVLATIRFHQAGAGIAQLHLRTLAEGATTRGTYISTPKPGAQPLPDIVTLIDGVVTLP